MAAPAQGQSLEPVSLSDRTEKMLHTQAEFLIDPDGAFSIDDIQGFSLAPFSNEGTMVDPEVDVYWFHVSVVYQGNRKERDFLMFFNQYIDTVEIYLPQPDGKLRVLRGGASVPFRQKALAIVGQKSAVVPITLPQSDTLSLYGRMVFKSYLAGHMGRVSFQIRPQDVFLVDKVQEQMLRGSILGALVFLFLLNVTLLFYYREKVQLAFITNLFFLLLFYISLFGYLRLLPLEGAWLAGIRMLDFVMGALGLASFLVFMHYYFKPLGKNRILELTIAALVGMLLLNMVIGLFIGYRFLNTLQFILAVVVSSLALGTSLYFTIAGYKPAIYFSIAIIFSVIGLLLFSLTNLNMIGYSDVTKYFLPVGEIFRSLFFTVGIFSRYRMVRKQLEQKKLEQEQMKKEQEETVRLLLEEKNKELERKVTKRTKELERQKKKLESSNRIKDKLFSIISHDLRSPLAALDGFLQLMKMKYLTEEEMDEMVLGMQGRLRRTQELVDNLLFWARSQMQGMVSNPQVINLKDITNAVVKQLENESTAKQIHIQNSLPPQLIAWADPDMVQLVIRNLLANALKFTPYNGSIIFTGGKDGDFVFMQVSDNGIGISKTNVLKIMNLQQFHSTKGTNNEQGTGLGLVLCKEFVEKNGGTITVESAEGKGSTFRFTLPYATKLAPIENMGLGR